MASLSLLATRISPEWSVTAQPGWAFHVFDSVFNAIFLVGFEPVDAGVVGDTCRCFVPVTTPGQLVEDIKLDATFAMSVLLQSVNGASKLIAVPGLVPTRMTD